MGCRLKIKTVVGLASFFLSSTFVHSSVKEPPLTLAEVLDSVEACYPQIEVARLEILKAQGNYLSARGQFDPKLNIYTNSTPVGGYINNYGDTEIIVPTLMNGLTLFGGYRNGNGDWPVYYQNFLTNSGGEYRTGLSLPLMRDRDIDEQRTALLTRKERIALNQEALAETKIKIYHEAIQAYWQWVQAHLQINVLNKLLQLAKIRQEAIEVQAKAGDLEALVIAENLQQIMQRQQLVNEGKMIAAQASVRLSLYYRDNEGNPKPPNPSQIPQQITVPAPLSVESITGLYDQIYFHPTLQKLGRQFQIMVLERNLAQNALLPHLNASAYTTKQYGTGGYPLLIPQAVLAGVTFKFPVYQRVAKGRLINANSALRQVDVEKKFLQDQLNTRLSELLIAGETYHRQIKLLSKELRLATKVQFGESRRFHEGDSTLFLVNQREQTTVQIELNVIRSKINLLKNYDLLRYYVSTSLPNQL
ncbi:MAG: TolC family protein [Legionella sp.]|nr:TolC family protein [Legionella sp.]